MEDKQEGTYSPRVLLDNLLALVRQHTNTCDGNCGVSLLLLRVLAERAGLEMTEEERAEFY